MKILLHTQFYPPEMGAPQARLSELARLLGEMGHEVSVLTAMPNYPAGKIFNGYERKLYLNESIDNISVHRSWIFPSNKKSLLLRLISYVSFCFSSLIAGLLKVGRHDILITESPPLFLAITGWLISRMKGSCWVMNVSDLWPESARHIGMLSENSLSYRTMASLARFLYRRAWLIIGQSKEIVGEIHQTVTDAKTYHFSNGVDTNKFSPGKKDAAIRHRYLSSGEIGVVYAGLHGYFQGLDQILHAAGQMHNDHVRFLFFGEGPEKERLKHVADELGLKNVNFYPPLPHEDVPAVLASMDIAIIPLKARITGAVPSKIYEAMASGLPVVLAASGEAAGIVEDSRAGIVVAPEDVEGLTSSIERLAESETLRNTIGEAARKAALGRFDRRDIVRRFVQALSERMGNK